MSVYPKDPHARIDYAIAWPASLIGAATIADSLWDVIPAEAGGVSIVASTIDGPGTSARIEGGIAGRSYRIANRISLSDGRSDARAITLIVEPR